MYYTRESENFVVNFSKNFSARNTPLNLFRQIHRGPDWRGLYTCDDVILSHERLSINGVLSGAQPIVSKDETVVLTVRCRFLFLLSFVSF